MGTVILVALTLAGVQAPVAQSVRTQESIGVYRAILTDARCSGRDSAASRGSVLVIRRELVHPADAGWAVSPVRPLRDRVRQAFPGVSESLADEFTGGRLTATQLAAGIVRELDAVSIPRADVDARVDGPAFWPNFFRTFPTASGLIELSAVAFDASGGDALVYCGYANGLLSGRGSIVRLQRTDGRWSPIAWYEVWIS